eukprot:scaffold10201_cov91-Skeletonema_dohrnii-CCMP3373.AAC.2
MMKKLQNNCVQMKATTPYPLPSPDSVEEKGGAPRAGGAIPSPRRHDMKQLHGHQQHSTVDSPTIPPLLDTTPGQPPSPPFLKKRSPQSKSQSHHRDEHEGQQQQQQNASAFVAAFLRDAASVTVPTKMSDHNSRCGSKKSSSEKRQQRIMRQNTYGSARSEASGNISLSSSIDNLSECLNELAKSSTKKGEKLKITTITTKPSEREGKKGCPRRLSSKCGDDDDDVSLVSNLSGWNDLVEKTFGYDDPHTESEQLLFGLHNPHNHANANVGEEKSCHRYDGGGSLELERNGSGHHRIDPTGTTLTPNTSSPNTSKTPPALKPILKVKGSITAEAGTESILDDSLLGELVALDDSYKISCTDTELDDSYKKSCNTSALDDSCKTSCTDSDMLEQFLAGMEPKGRNCSEKRGTKCQSKGLSSSMGNIHDMMEDMFLGDEDVEHPSFDRFGKQNQNPFASTKERSSASERARIERLKKKKAAMHTRALQDSAQSKSAAHTSPQKPRTRNNSYDDADRFLRSLEEASAALHKSKMNDGTNDQREEGLSKSGMSSKPVHRLRGDEDAKSFDAFDEMLAEIEEEERRLESALFGSKSKSRQREHLLNMQKEGAMQSSRSTNSSLSRHTTKVICLKWVDRRGMVGHFTGEVNSMIQPHGKGILVYENGLVLDCNWCNGTPSAGSTPSTGINDDTVATSQKEHAAVVSEEKSNQFLPDYDLGMAARSRHDMKEEDPDKAMEGISRLKKLDFAFVRRSNKQWTYSIICDRTEDSIRFVIDEVGRTKKIGRDRWLKNIRRIQKSSSRHQTDHSHHHKKHHHSRHHRRRSTSVPARRKKLEP